MDKVYVTSFKTSFGELLLGAFNDEICLCDWKYREHRNHIDNRVQNSLKAVYVEGSTDLLEDTKLQLKQYFKGERKAFDLPLKLCGSKFQTTVWIELLNLNHGQTLSYLQLSRQLKNEKAIRAVASANGANAISIIIPCHRIIGSGGALTGYAGGLITKKKLLLLEGAITDNQLELF